MDKEKCLEVYEGVIRTVGIQKIHNLFQNSGQVGSKPFEHKIIRILKGI
jgi:hypothetical protein